MPVDVFRSCVLFMHRRRLYRSVFEYDLPMVNPEPQCYQFVKPEESTVPNPWKDSFKLLVRVSLLHYFNSVICSNCFELYVFLDFS